MEEIAKKICRIVSGPVSLEGGAQTYEELVAEGKKLAAIAKNVVVKIPMTVDGIKAVQTLSQRQIKTNVTLVFSAHQALLAAKAGANYVSPFLGRLDDVGQGGSELLSEILTIFTNYQYPTEVIAASIRHPDHVKQAALLGCHIATVPFKVLNQMFHHPLTEKGITLFQKDWQNLKK
jgi:transaldolase